MAFYISNPQMSFIAKLKLYLSARRDAKSGHPELDQDGRLLTNTLRAMEAKANEAIQHELTRYNGRKHAQLRAVYVEYVSCMYKLKQAYKERDDAIEAAQAVRLPGDEELDPAAMKERIAARSVKPKREYAARIARLKSELDEMADKANKEYDLAGYAAVRLEAAAHCDACALHHYYWPAEVYCLYLSRCLGVAKGFEVPEFRTDWPTQIEQVLPELDFNQHSCL